MSLTRNEWFCWANKTLFSGTSSSDRTLEIKHNITILFVNARVRRTLTRVRVTPDVAEDAVPRQQHADSTNTTFPHVDVFPVIPLPA